MTDYKKAQYWSKFANTIDEDEKYMVGGTAQQLIVERLSREGGLGELIELGCGTGLYTKVLAANASHVMATDLCDGMLAVARTQLKDLQNVTVDKVDCEKTDFPDGKFDSVFMANLIHIVENPPTTLQEAYRILKDGGLLLIMDFTTCGVKPFEKMKLGVRTLRRGYRPRRHFRSLSPEGLRSLVENAGFKVEEVQLMGDKGKALFLKGRKG
jgi:ubiquinone/menaquinone biosynthesis C-methylase UbiE